MFQNVFSLILAPIYYAFGSLDISNNYLQAYFVIMLILSVISILMGVIYNTKF